MFWGGKFIAVAEAMLKTLMMKNMAVFCVFLLTSAAARASSDCQRLKQELQLMQQANHQVMNSLINNHEAFVSSLEEYSMVIDMAPRRTAVIVKKMRSSAEAFRVRGLQGKKIAMKLSASTNDLLFRVNNCLK